MQLLAGVIVLMAVTTKGVLNELNPEGRNVCLETVNYTEVIQVKIKVPDVEYGRCLFPFKLFPKIQPCRTAKTVLVEKVVPKVVSRSKIMPICCSGYIQTNNTETECVPDCSSGCENGKCVAPLVCDCQDGYFGELCEKSCLEGMWGKNCNNKCDCLNNGACDKTYGCVCQPGWKGSRCESPCEDGYYGYECKKKCPCNGDACSHITGECIISTTEATTISTTEDIVTSTTEAVIISTTEDIVTSTTEAVNISTTEDIITSTAETTEDTIILTKDEIISVMDATTTITSAIFTTTTNEYTPSFTDQVTSTEESTVSTKNSAVLHQSGKGSSGEETIFKWLHFLPSLSVLSATSFLIIAIAAKWVITQHRRKQKMALAEKDRNAQTELKFQAENVFMGNHLVNYYTVSPVYTTDVDLHNQTTTTLETFKPINDSTNQK